MFMTRALTATIALAVFLTALFFLPQQLWGLFLLLGLAVAGWEWAALAGCARAGRAGYAVLITASALVFFYVDARLGASAQGVDLFLYAASCIFWIGVAPFWLGQRWALRNKLVLAATGWIALVPMWLALVRLQATPWALLLFMSIVWFADTAAYVTGKQWGRHKLAPLISPGKTWEGALGALCVIAVYYGALLLVLAPAQRYFDGWSGLALFAAILVLSVEGDLFESWMKRQAGVKDSGHFLPGHGGILDRIDGLTATIPAAALAFYLR